MAADVPVDDKDWTWVLERVCPECGYDAASVEATDVSSRVRDSTDRWVEVLGRPDVAVRPRADVWSALEYGCHVRDVFRRFDERLQLMLDHDDPQFANWDQDETAIAERYGEQDPSTVAGELRVAGERIADSFADVGGEEWQRGGRRSDGAAFTVDSFARYFVHDVVHHLHDVGAPR